MTEEEKLAEEYLDKRYLKDMGVRNPCKEAFLSGLKAGKNMAETDLATVAYIQGAERYKPKWHKVEEKLPPLWEGSELMSVRVVDNYDRIIIYDYNSERWRDYEGDSLGIQPDYWCVIPQFKE